jgi:hypothetical protein
MNLLKLHKLFRLPLLPVLAVGLFFALQTDIDKGSKESPISPPSVIVPGGQGYPQSPSIVPDRDKTQIEYRNIIFKQDNRR